MDGDMSVIKPDVMRSNPLGDTTAENDQKMLSDAFVPTTDKTLIFIIMCFFSAYLKPV